MFPNGLSHDAWAKSVELTRKDFYEPNITYMVIVDDELNEIISISKWLVQLHERPESEWDQPLERRIIGEGGNQEVADTILGAIDSARRKNLKGRPHCRKSASSPSYSYLTYQVLWLLDTLPNHQRRGAGSMLLEWGTREADQAGLFCYLEASPAGYPLYQRYGFLDINEMVVDFSPFGRNVKSRHVCMHRPLQGKSTTSVKA